MTDRIHALTVVLDEDIRDDDVKSIVDAICMIVHVASVTSHVADTRDHSARERIRGELIEKLYGVLGVGR